MQNILKIITEKQKRIQAFRPFPPELVKNLEAWFKIELTYTSNAIEGNALSRKETALVIEKGLTVAGKSLTEHLEAVNHGEALEWLQGLPKKKKALTERELLDLHHLILQKIDDAHAGRYRSVPVRISGSTVILPNPRKVPELMKEFISWLQKRHRKEHPAVIASEAHLRLVTIHPFIDGNGRTARLLMNLLLLQAGYPPALIKKEERLKYLNALEKAQMFGIRDEYDELIFRAIDRSLNIYLKAFEREEPDAEVFMMNPFLKIGALAKATGESIPTIRYWTQQGLLEIADHTEGGYALYQPNMVEQAKKIRILQKEKRMNMEEIKIALSSLSR